MDFDRKWTEFALDAEVDTFGTSRIVNAHNALMDEAATLRARIEELEREVEHRGQAIQQATIPLDIAVFNVGGVEYRVVKTWILGVTYRHSWTGADCFDLTMRFATVGPPNHWLWNCVTKDVVDHVLNACGLLKAEKGEQGGR